MFKRIVIDGEYKKPVSDFSGGMKRRVAILRALMADFDILVMDEPLKGLDEETKGSVVELIRELTEGKIVIMTTHDPAEPKLFDAGIIQI
ncbi:MAG: ATP-binding cassette domain-containing protein [Lachnospiraceae bacterium]|nr:ATP-binding cassette domain-containing protein [Lachnospiraceae bacterium]